MKDYYYILGVKAEATQEEIKQAYRKLSTKFHPDKNDGDDFFSERFKEIQEAWEVLGNETKRADYDYEKFGGTNRNEKSTPKIISFKANKTTFDLDEEVTFNWATLNADKVTINPFGLVIPSGSKTYRIKIIKSTTLSFELIAENSSTNKTATSSLTLTKRNTQIPPVTTGEKFNLYEWITDNKEAIDKILSRLALGLSIVYCIVIGYSDFKYCIENSTYEPLEIKRFMYYLGGDWALFADWVYSPTSFTTINTLVGWIFKIIFVLPLPLLLMLGMWLGFMIWLKAIEWIVKMAAKMFGTKAGIAAFVVVALLLIKWFT